MDYRPRSPDLSSLDSPDLAAIPHQQHHRFGAAFSGHSFVGNPLTYPTSAPQRQESYNYDAGESSMTSRGVKSEADADYLPDAPATYVRRGAGHNMGGPSSHAQATSDSTLGVHLKTSFPVARIKRIMQADEDI
ncbi:hypothetical protein LTR53_019410, partial [Teratosphaeriaceae sp. CCFEE 6253]